MALQPFYFQYTAEAERSIRMWQSATMQQGKDQSTMDSTRQNVSKRTWLQMGGLYTNSLDMLVVLI